MLFFREAAHKGFSVITSAAAREKNADQVRRTASDAEILIYIALGLRWPTVTAFITNFFPID
jgi:S-adenosylmethionine:tRNA-ribosyltransferase-isomerase (queuine synthetase)